jgi:glucose dehydrogenase
MASKGWTAVGGVAAAAMVTACAPAGSSSGTGNDWPLYRGDLAGTGYSALSEITPANAASLGRAWSYDLAAAEPAGGRGRSPNSQATPIVVEDVMYLPAADRIVALDPTTGGELWRHAVSDNALTRRGVAYWPGDGAAPRIFFMAGARLIAIDAASGTPAEGFGDGGEVDIGIPYNSVPLVYENIVVVGANTPPGAPGGIGNARAFDARDGSPVWEFSSVPQAGHAGHDTWQGDSWQGRLGVNAWPFYFTLDEERELLYLPLAAPIPFWYGGTGPARTSSATRSSRSTYAPAPTSGTSRRSTTICGTTTRRRPPSSSTPSSRAAPCRRSA